MSALIHQQLRMSYSTRSSLGDSEVPVARPGDLEPVSYERFDASIAIIENSEGIGIITVRRGAVVFCDAANIGFVSGFLLDTSNGAISHLLLRHDLPTEKTEQIVPVNDIISCEIDKIRLR
jgi:hypothetical protein